MSAVGLLAAASAAAAALSWILGDRFALAGPALIAFALFVALGDLLEIPLGRQTVFSLGVAPALGFALYRQCGDALPCANWISPSSAEVATVVVLGSLCSLLVRRMLRRPTSLLASIAQLPVVIVAAATYRAIVEAAPPSLSFGPASQPVSSVGLAGVLVVVLILDVLLQALLAIARDHLSFRQAVTSQFRAAAPLLLSTVSLAALLALAYPTFGWVTLPLFFAPLAATQYSFRQIATIRKNYLQTVRALSKVPEMAGYLERGHSIRVAELATDIAKELGALDQDLLEIEYAALLHDIGRISLPDPEEASKSSSTLQLALVGAGIIEETGHLPAVARMVRDQHEPYRRRGEDINRTLSLGAKIIKVASAFDDLTHPSGPGRTPWDALERLHLGMAYDYDPAVIQALTRVLERSGRV